MQFQDKLEILFKLSGVSGGQLARAINADPATISRLRRGTRGVPRNHEIVRQIADFFSKKLESDYQRIGLSEIMERPMLRLLTRNADIADAVYLWLTEQDNTSAQSFTKFMGNGNITTGDMESAGAEDIEKSNQTGLADVAYFGNEGKREAVCLWLQVLLKQKKPGTLLIASDENSEWLLESPPFFNQLSSTLMELIKRGFKIRRISSPQSCTVESAMGKCKLWFPLYPTGQMESFHYCRIRDNLFHRTLFVAPGIGAVTANSIGCDPKSGMTLVTFEKKLVNAYQKEYYSYEKLCTPLVTSYVKGKNTIQLFGCLDRYERYKAFFIQQAPSLPSVLTPECVLTRLDEALARIHMRPFSLPHGQNQSLFSECIKENRCIDIITLADKDKILAGEVPIPVSQILLEQPLFYSTEEYKAHLEAILQYMELYDNYSVFIEQNPDDDESLLYAKEGYALLIARRSAPYTLFEITENNIVAASIEFLRQKCNNGLSYEAQKAQAKLQIKYLLAQL